MPSFGEVASGGLAPDGACLAALVTLTRGALLPHHFTLTFFQRWILEASIFVIEAVYFLWRFP